MKEVKMQALFGEVRQLGFVVENLEVAIQHWVKVMNVGPWFVADPIPISHFRYKDSAKLVQISVALANVGDIQVELIQQKNSAPSIYQDFLQEKGPGLQHVAYWTTRYEEELRLAQQNGLKVVMCGEVGTDGRYAYFDSAERMGTTVELSEIAGPKGVAFSLIREASAKWNGSEPVRPFPDLSKL